MKADQASERVQEIEVEIAGEEYLLSRAAERGFVTYDDILKAFPNAEDNMDELEDILANLIEAGIEVGAPSESEAKSEPQAPTKPEKRTDEVADRRAYFDTIVIDDPIGLYLKEIGRVPLLVAEEEVMLAKRMEAGINLAQKELEDDGLSPTRRAELAGLVSDGLAAREHLIRANSRLVISVAKK